MGMDQMSFAAVIELYVLHWFSVVMECFSLLVGSGVSAAKVRKFVEGRSS
jgi:hypothetical protein